jgi:serine/threonine-protein kinase
MAATQQGVILGTAAYMSPEQAKGKPVDKRADIWAYGCVLFEMVSGRSTFTGQSATEIFAQVIEREPDWTALPVSTPASIRRLLRRCLEKDARKRLADIADARLELDEASATSDFDAAGAATSNIARRGRLAWSAALAALALAIVAIAGLVRASWLQPLPHPLATYVAATLSVATPNLVTLVDRFAVAPDGSAIVFVGPERSGLFLRRPANLDPTPIPGVPREAFLPVFSPDGKWLACHGPRTDEDLWRWRPARRGEQRHVHQPDVGSDDRLRYPSSRGTRCCRYRRAAAR